MASNYPDNVSGFEYQIAGPDYERESDEICEHKLEDGRECGAQCIEAGYSSDRWLTCSNGHTTELPTDLDDDGPDPDAVYDRMREERFGIE